MEKISVKTMLGYLPDELLDSLSLVHSVDKYVKKLEGKIVFKLLLYGVLSSTQLSLNVPPLARIYNDSTVRPLDLYFDYL